MKREEEIRNELTEMSNSSVKDIFDALSKHEGDVFEYLLQMVASLCNVSCDDIKHDKRHFVYIAQSRWFFWYAYRYMTGEPYMKISSRFNEKYGTNFHYVTVTKACTKMMNLISEDGIWRKRWILIKRIINTYNDVAKTAIPKLDVQSTVRMVIYKPSSVNIKVEFKDVDE